MNSYVTNLSDKKMPHYFGWHCYFTVTDKGSAKLAAPFDSYTDYSDGKLRAENPTLL